MRLKTKAVFSYSLDSPWVQTTKFGVERSGSVQNAFGTG